jgi:hypothetical protein
MKNTILALIIGAGQCLLKTCSPSFHDKFLSSGDEINMRWEYCTKMTFSKDGYAEWHSKATYRNKDYFQKLFMNYLIENKHLELDAMD